MFDREIGLVERFSGEPMKIWNVYMIANGSAVFYLSQSEGLRLSPKGARVPPCHNEPTYDKIISKYSNTKH